MHQHGENCGCGDKHNGCGHHHHEHGESCGCGHDHHHAHGENCGCGHEHVPIPTPEGMSPLQVDVLLGLRQRRWLPVACFALTKSDDDTRYAVTLSPVYLGTQDDTMEQVKALGSELALLENMGLITLDYDIPLDGYAYEEYKTSALYAYFVQTVAEAAKLPNPTFDTPRLELGSMALTDEGEKMVDELIK